MKTHTSDIYSLRRKKRIDYLNYQIGLALYTIYKEESRKEARLPVNDFRNRAFRKQSSTTRLKQKLGFYTLMIRKAVRSFFRKATTGNYEQQLT